MCTPYVENLSNHFSYRDDHSKFNKSGKCIKLTTIATMPHSSYNWELILRLLDYCMIFLIQSQFQRICGSYLNYMLLLLNPRALTEMSEGKLGKNVNRIIFISSNTHSFGHLSHLTHHSSHHDWFSTFYT